MKLTESFSLIFEDKLRLSEDQVKLTRSEPMQKQDLENDVTLFIRAFPHYKFSTLLIATQTREEGEFFVFGYWIPDYLLVDMASPLDTLKRFAEEFGCKIKISNDVGQFIERSFKQVTGIPRSLYDVVEILENDEIPCESFAFYHEETQNEFTNVSIYYAFSINNNKYYLWLYDIDTIKIKVPKEWHDYLDNISKALDPYGKTKLKIYNPANGFEIDIEKINKKTKESVLDRQVKIPKTYEKSFQHIINVMLSLGPNQKIAVIPRLQKEICVFCQSKEISQEHIFSKWLRNFFPDKKIDYHIGFGLPQEPFLNQIEGLSVNKETLYGITTHKVCIDCNTQWMSQLEEKIKSILLDKRGQLVQSIESLVLDIDRSHLLGQWLCIKALLLMARVGLLHNIPSDTFQQLKDSVIPENFLIEVFEFDSYDFDYEISIGVLNGTGSIKLKGMNPQLASEIAKGFFKASILIGKLFFRISYLDESKKLVRNSIYKKTTMVYPANYDLQFTFNDEIEKEWADLENIYKRKLFHLGLVLDEVE